MRKIIYLTILITIVYKWCVLGNIRFDEENRVSAGPIGGWEESRFIAHAFGGVEGFHYTNSYEAFVSNYLKGYRLFETDLVNTADGELIASHDFSQNKARMTVEQFQGSLIMGKFHSLTMTEILQLMIDYPDFYLIIDSKESNTEHIRRQFEILVSEAIRLDPILLERIIPEIFSPTMYETVMNIYPFPNTIYSLYKSNASASSIVKFVKEKQISAVAMPAYRVIVNPTLVNALSKLGVKSYVHTVDNIRTMQVLKSIGVHGVYTNLEVTPTELAQAVDDTNPFQMVGYIPSAAKFLFTKFKANTILEGL